MRVMILGGDGYLGWPTAMYFAGKGYEVCVIDNYLRRNIAQETRSESLIPNPNLHDRAEIFKSVSGKDINVIVGDCVDYAFLCCQLKEFMPDVIVHYAEQPSAPYSMMGRSQAALTLNNNLNATFNLIWAVIEHVPKAHIIKLGTMGEYGTPNIDIEEGWIDIQHNGRTDKFLFPRQAGSLYHTTKILDTDLLWFYVRSMGIKVTDLMQGPVYGLSTDEADQEELLMPNFHYDDIFGTVVNRFLVQAVAGVPLTVYGRGGQTRGYLNLKDTLQCVELAMKSPVDHGVLRILNQFTEQFSVIDLAERIRNVGNELGLKVEIKSIENPRKELEDHYYNAKHKGLLELGLKPNYMTPKVIEEMLKKVMKYKSKIRKDKIFPRVRWS